MIKAIITLLMTFSLFADYSQIRQIHPGLFCRIIKTSKNKKTILLDIGKEEIIKKNDSALISYHGQNVARLKLIKLSSSRSIWQVEDDFDPAKISTNQVFLFKFVSNKEFTEERNERAASEIKPDYQSPFDFPLWTKSVVSLSAASGSRYRTDYDYPVLPEVGNKGQRLDLSGSWLFKSELDDRFYLGTALRLMAQNNRFNLKDLSKVNEKRSRYGIGPMFRVNFWGNIEYTFSASVNLLMYYDSVNIVRSLNNISFESKFSNFTFGHVIGLDWSFNRMLGRNHLFIGLKAITDYPHSLKSKNLDSAAFNADEIENKTHTNILAQIGIHIPLRI